MQKPDQHKIPAEPAAISDQIHKFDPATPTSHTTRRNGFDWPAISIVLLIAAFFAFTVRLNSQPPTSVISAAVFSATGCGLLITALRKLRSVSRPGLIEAAVAGFFLALLQFLAALSYPGVFSTLQTDLGERTGFLAAWGLVAAFSILFSIIGGALGHLAFAPLRPLSAKVGESTTIEDLENPAQEAEQQSGNEHAEDQEAFTEAAPVKVSDTASRSFVSYLIPVLLLGLLPVAVGLVFSAAYDFTLGLYHFSSGPYPTLRVLSTMLPWQIPISINLSGANASSLILLLWRIPLFLGNPTMFDGHALEPYIFNSAAIAILLLKATQQVSNTSPSTSRLSWRAFLLLEFTLGLLLVLPADIWILQGLQGLLQIGNFAIPLRTLHLLNPLTFTLNLITGPLLCLGIGILLHLRIKA